MERSPLCCDEYVEGSQGLASRPDHAQLANDHPAGAKAASAGHRGPRCRSGHGGNPNQWSTPTYRGHLCVSSPWRKDCSWSSCSTSTWDRSIVYAALRCLCTSVQPMQDGESSLQLGHPSGHVPQKGNRDNNEPEKAAPARASRRLEARRWACCSLHAHSCMVPSMAYTAKTYECLPLGWRDVVGYCDHVGQSMQAKRSKPSPNTIAAPASAGRAGLRRKAEAEAGEVNVLALLSPFMTRQPPSREGTPLPAPPAHSSAPASAACSHPSQAGQGCRGARHQSLPGSLRARRPLRWQPA